MAELIELIESHEPGTVFRVENGDAVVVDEPRAPEPYANDPHHLGDMGEWTALEGLSGHHGHDGPFFHPSELVGAGLAQHLLEDALSAGGYLTACAVTVFSDDDEDDDPSIEWIIAARPLDD